VSGQALARLAERSGDPHVVSQVLNSFACLRCFTGAVNEAFDPFFESIRRADGTGDKALRVAVRYGLCLAHWYAARFREFLALVGEGLDIAQGDLDIGADRIGFSPGLGFSMLRGVTLSVMGHLRKGGADLDRVIELALVSQQFVPLWVSHCFHVFRCEVTGDAPSALAHARAAVDYAERTGSPQGRMVA
jgi:hypothetical protein